MSDVISNEERYELLFLQESKRRIDTQKELLREQLGRLERESEQVTAEMQRVASAIKEKYQLGATDALELPSGQIQRRGEAPKPPPPAN